MKPKTALRIISIPSLIICFSVFIFHDFYFHEVLKNFDSIERKELGFLINLCAICGVNSSILIFFASTLDEKNAKRMLKGVAFTLALTAISLFTIIFTTSIRIPYYILFMVLIFSIFSYSIYRQKLD